MQIADASGSIGFLVALAIMVFIIAALWKVFAKAGKPGWACLVPIYNAYVLCEIAGKPGWWVVLFLIPVVNVVIALLVALGVAEKFGKGAGFGVGIFFLPVIFYPVLAFGDAAYGSASK